jgi:hypothetical protein
MGKNNRSMIEDLHRDKENLAMRANKTQYLEGLRNPIGHVLSVLVEELGDSKPNTTNYLDAINQYVAIGGNEIASFTNLSDIVGEKGRMGLSRFLKYLKHEGKLTQNQSNRILNSALGYEKY